MTHSDPNVNDPTASGAGQSMPVAPQYQPQAAAGAPVERPTSVTRAVQLMYVGAALSAIGIVLTWLTKDELRDQVAAASPSLSSDGVESAVSISLGIATAIGVISVVLWLWMAATNGAGKSWARIVATVLGGLSVLSALFTLTSGTGITIAMTVVSLVLAVAILVLLWRPASSEFFRARSARTA